MKLTLRPSTVENLEELAGEKISRNGDAVIQKVCEMAEKNNRPDEPCWVEADESGSQKEDADAKA